MQKLYQKNNSRPPTVLPRFKKHPSRLVKYWFKFCQRRFFVNIRKLKGNPVFLARGLAIGVFTGCFPLLGLQSLIGVLFAIICRGSKAAAIAGTWISNPITYIPLFILNFRVGKFLLGVQSISSQDIDFESLSSFMELGWKFAVIILVGSSVIGLCASVISYIVSLRLFKKLQNRQIRDRKIQRNPRKQSPVDIPK